jgi:hypothetical protein
MGLKVTNHGFGLTEFPSVEKTDNDFNAAACEKLPLLPVAKISHL